MDLQVGGLADLEDRVETALDEIARLQLGTRIRADAFFSDPFMAAHTEFDSFAGFCEQSPWSLDEPRAIQTVPREALDDYVAAETDFDSWEAMKTQAAQERIIDQVQA